MYRKMIIPALLLIFLCSSFRSPAAAESSGGFVMEEEDVDITTMIEMAQEEKAKEKKDSDGAYIMTVTCTGDFTIGKDMNHKDLFSPELEKNGDDINFVMQNVRELFMEDDLTIVNFEGTLTDSRYKPAGKNKDDFLFSISPSYVSVLPDNGVEAVSLDNNHVRDHGEEGLADTKAALENAGVIYSTPLEIGVYDYKGMIQVAMLSYNCIDRYGDGFKKERFRSEYREDFLQHDTFEEAVCADIARAKEMYPLVIVSFHWGIEKRYTPTENQVRLGRMAVDAGADLVIGTHSHRIQPIELYNGKLICYSLANFCFAGNSKPSDMSSIIFQARYRVKDGNVSYKDFRIIPIRISSTKDRNNFIPYIYTSGYEQDSVLIALKDNSKNLTYAVQDYPLEFDSP